MVNSVFTINFSDNSDLRRGLKSSLRDVWDGDISRSIVCSFKTNITFNKGFLFSFSITVPDVSGVL